MALNRLSARTVETKTKRGRYADGGGLFLQVSKWGTKAWIFRYERNGRERNMGLGATHTLALADARERARECRQVLLDGRDPIEARTAKRARQRLEAMRELKFKDFAAQHHAAQQAGWQSEKHRHDWMFSIETYAYPVLGELPVASIDTALVMKCLEPIWRVKPQTAKRVRARVESVLNFATVSGFRQGDNPARWRGHLDNLLPAPGKVRKVRHYAALPYAELPEFMAELRARPELSARALEVTVLTALRTWEVLGAPWSELDMAAKVWTIPAARMKGDRDHRVPLSARVLEILGELPRAGVYVFPDRFGTGKPISDDVMLRLLCRMGRGGPGDITVHGFRSTFRDWAAETTAYPNHVVEMALAHAIGDEVEAAYRRGDLFEKRRRLMNEWAKYCAQPNAVKGANVALFRSV
jgi:integrase